MQQDVPSEVICHAGNIPAVSIVEKFALREPHVHFAKLSPTKISLMHRCVTFHIFIRETVRKILTEDFGMRKVCAKMVPKELTEEQKNRGVFS
jgi:hypothetical protein